MALSSTCFLAMILLGIAHDALSQQGDCSSLNGQITEVKERAKTDPECYNPIMVFMLYGQVPTAEQVRRVCQKKCAGEMLSYLEECGDNAVAQHSAYILRDEICGYRDGLGAPESNCLLVNYTNNIEVAIRSCFAWWLGTDKNVCPPPTPGAQAPLCNYTLQAVADGYGCCLNNLYGSEEAKKELTREAKRFFRGDYEIDVTDQKLFEVCGVSIPSGMCESHVSSGSTVTSTLYLILFFIIVTISF